MTEYNTPKMTHDEMIDTLKGLGFRAFDRMTAKEREALDMAIEVLEQEPKTGRWIGVNPFVDTMMCSECGENIISEEFKSNYCPNCGAKMVEPQETQESDHKCHTCKHYTSGEHDGSCGSYICKEYSNWESEVSDADSN